MPLALIWQALTAIFLVAFSHGATAQALRALPALTARVIDQTSTLAEADRQALDARLAAIEQQRGAQVVVLMVPTTAPEDIAAFANRVGNAWKIGRRDVGDGVLVLVAKDDRRMRIEVAKALEGALPDIAAARIIDEAMKPRFRSGDFAGGLAEAVRRIDQRLSGEALPAPSSGSASASADDGDMPTLVAGVAFFVLLGLGSTLRAMMGRLPGSLATGGIAGGLAWVLTSSVALAIGAALFVACFTGIGGTRGRPRWTGRQGGVWTTGGGGGWSSGSSSGGGFSSGGGGDFGGGGASGDW
ncbi:MAG: TPM domain-containing protein [Acidovorax sp.]|uniref:TPM domain-containing protein n=1 Tax=Acidovorax sp. TaxID=1872122 RepID=UPI0039E48AAD